jgi:hypothetical protein
MEIGGSDSDISRGGSLIALKMEAVQASETSAN